MGVDVHCQFLRPEVWPPAANSIASLVDDRLPASVHKLDLTRSPRLREERLQWTIQTQQRVPALFRVGLNPVTGLDAVGPGRGEIDGRRTVGIRLGGGCRIALAAGTWVALRRVEHRAGLVVIDRERPECL